MTRKQALAEIESALDAPPGSIREDTELGSVKGWDSVGQLSVMATLDAKFGVVVPPHKLVACKTAADVLAFVNDKLE
jgi:acyl carrier protein